MTPPLLVSMAHVWRPNVTGDAGAWPAKNTVRCADCGAITVIGCWDVPRCQPRLEAANAGFPDESPCLARRLVRDASVLLSTKEAK